MDKHELSRRMDDLGMNYVQLSYDLRYAEGVELDKIHMELTDLTDKARDVDWELHLLCGELFDDSHKD